VHFITDCHRKGTAIGSRDAVRVIASGVTFTLAGRTFSSLLISVDNPAATERAFWAGGA
jgi:hypothetical protein